MNEFIVSIILAIVQGITEWLPVSSSGHLVLFQEIFNFHNDNLAFDVALHFGTLMAVFVYFGKDITDILESVFRWKYKSQEFKLALLLIISAIPAAIVGYFLEPIFEAAFQSLYIVAIGFAITG